MLTSVQKEILQSLITLYRKFKGKSIKGEEIAEIMNRNPGTIRNQMQSLRSLGLVKGIPGPQGGYKPTIEAYHTLNISSSDKEAVVPIYKDEKRVKDLNVAKIEFISIPHPGECEASIKVVGNLKQLDLGDKVRIGPTPVNKLVVNGIVVGRDDMDNILLLDTSSIMSIPHKSVREIASLELVTLKPNMTLKDAAIILSSREFEGAPVIEDNKVLGMLTQNDITKAIAEGNEKLKVNEIMSSVIVTVDEGLMISEAIETMNKNNVGRVIVMDKENIPIGIVTRTDLLNKIAYLK
ncbi:MAG: CBS domain-containing protein [Methanobacterium sp.]